MSGVGLFCGAGVEAGGVGEEAEEQKGEHGSRIVLFREVLYGAGDGGGCGVAADDGGACAGAGGDGADHRGGARSLAGYRKYGGYGALEKVRSRAAEDALAVIEGSNLRGRGGAGFPTGRKWRAVAQQPAGQKYVVANADEGDPGAFIDRFVIEDDPHCLIEAMMIAAHAVGASKGFIYLRKEYPAAIAVLEEALREAREAGILGTGFDLVLFEGHGSYICGEETALLNSIEGRRAEVRARPPYPTESGLWGKPTLVNNVETFANVPWIINHGAEAYAKLGFSKSQGTKVVSLNSLFNRPGLYEVEFGVSLRYIVEELGGGLKTGG